MAFGGSFSLERPTRMSLVPFSTLSLLMFIPKSTLKLFLNNSSFAFLKNVAQGKHGTPLGPCQPTW